MRVENLVRRIALPALMGLAAMSMEAFGCSVCFGDPNSSMTHGMNMGILTLLLFILPVLGGFGFFVGYLVWRANHPLESESAIVAAARGN